MNGLTIHLFLNVMPYLLERFLSTICVLGMFFRRLRELGELLFKTFIFDLLTF